MSERQSDDQRLRRGEQAAAAGPRARRRAQDLNATGELTDLHHAPPTGRRMAVLTLGALGIVYGDIGTSPLYTLRECFHGAHAIAVTPANVLGVLSLILWSLVLIISIKYLAYVMRYDNDGEGGILALMALVPANSVGRRRHWAILTLGLFGAALLYGDGMITPAITVLSSVEGLEVATPLFAHYVIPITIVILVLLFAVQRRGTGGIGVIFGPVMTVWFLVLAALGIRQILLTPSVLAAVSPHHAVSFFLRNGWLGFLVLGAVFLVVTGGEALYADMGHFGKRPIRIAWFALVQPALLINYFGQGALLVRDPSAADNPFYRTAPSWALLPLVALAAAAAVIASQAVISGAFSLTRQAVQLGYCPRLSIVHTSAAEAGQIYVPAVNWALMLATIGLVLGFKDSSHLAAAYGIAVTTTMVITALIAYVVSRKAWGWSRPMALAVTVPILLLDLAFFGANAVKIAQGGWFPILAAGVVYVLLSTWKRGRELLAEREASANLPVDLFLQDVERRQPTRVRGVAVFLSTSATGVPRSLLHNFKHNRILHDTVILLSVVTEDVPFVRARNRLAMTELGQGFHRVVAHYGFMEDPDVPRLVEKMRRRGHDFDPGSVSYFLGRDSLIATRRRGMALWRERLFVLMKRNSIGATRFFKLPPNRIVELGAQIEL